jgi:hypothetical protein
MNFGEMFPSNYLAQDDFPAPKTLVIARVSIDEVRRPGGVKVKKPILHFTAGKPMVLNKTNGVVLAKRYGRNSDDWTGKPIEVYAEPNVNFGGELVGGLRVRVPATAPATNGTPVKPVAPVAPVTALDAHKTILDGLATSRSKAKADEFLAWGEKRGFDFTPLQQDEQSDAYHDAMARLGLLEPATDIRDKDIPF